MISMIKDFGQVQYLNCLLNFKSHCHVDLIHVSTTHFMSCSATDSPTHDLSHITRRFGYFSLYSSAYCNCVQYVAFTTFLANSISLCFRLIITNQHVSVSFHKSNHNILGSVSEYFALVVLTKYVDVLNTLDSSNMIQYHLAKNSLSHLSLRASLAISNCILNSSSDFHWRMASFSSMVTR